jgi:uncharacterized membrane protein (UPF0182 family)
MSSSPPQERNHLSGAQNRILLEQAIRRKDEEVFAPNTNTKLISKGNIHSPETQQQKEIRKTPSPEQKNAKAMKLQETISPTKRKNNNYSMEMDMNVLLKAS